MEINRSKNFDEFTRSAQHYQTPAQNMAFISKAGDIALRVQGRLPIKAEGQGIFVQEGNKSANGWQGWIPKDQTPAVLNPPRGFISSANQRSTGPEYPYFYNGRFEQYRGRTLNRKLSKLENGTVEDMMALQFDNFNLKGEDFLPLLFQSLKPATLNEEALANINELKNWDYQSTKDSRAAALFEIWFKAFKGRDLG